MGNELEQLLNFKVHAIFHVRDADEIDALHKSVTFQFINDTQEDLEAREHILELQRTVPANIVGIPRTARLRKWRDEWFVDMFGPGEYT